MMMMMMKREVTTEKMVITIAERNRSLEIITAITYSSSPEEYETNVKLLEGTKITSVLNYFKANWDPIKVQWVKCFKDSYFCLGETTNNRIESTFGKIKNICIKFSSLCQFFEEFFIVLGVLRNESNNQYLMAIAKRGNCLRDIDEIKLANIATPYALDFILKKKQHSCEKDYIVYSADNVTFSLKNKSCLYICTINSCRCNFMKKLALPCHHIFFLRNHLKINLFDENFIHRRWTMEYYKSCFNVRFNNDNECMEINQAVTHIFPMVDKSDTSKEVTLT